MTPKDEADSLERAESLYRSAEEDPTSVDVVAVVECLATEDAAVRHEAAKAFTEITTVRPDAVEVAAERLASLLDADEAAVRNGAALTIAQLADRHQDALQRTAPALRTLVQRDTEYARNNALLALASLGESNPDTVTPVADTLVTLLDEETPYATRERAARALAAVAEERPEIVLDNVERLRAFLASEIPTAEAGRGLEVSPQDAEEVLEGASHAQSALGHAAAALRDAASASPQQFVAHTATLTTLATHDDEVVSTAALDALTAVAEEDPDAVLDSLPELVDIVVSAGDEAIQLHAAITVSTLAESHLEPVAAELREHVSVLRELLDADIARARTTGATMLSYVAERSPQATEPAVAALVAALDDEELAVRASAAHALGFVGTDGAVDALEECATDDPAPEVQQAAREALTIAGADPHTS